VRVVSRASMNGAAFKVDVGVITRNRYCLLINTNLLYCSAVDFGDVDDWRHEAECFVKDAADHAVVKVTHIDVV
jgi:hypothetical protein